MDEKRVVVGRLQAVVGPPAGSPRRAAKVGGEPPEWIQIFPDGEYSFDWEGRGQTALCDDESRALVIAAFAARGNDMVIDYEHQTLDGDQAPAAGWIKELADRGTEGLWARVEWTSKAKEYLASGEYRYDSPVFTVDEKTNRVVQLYHVALTNWPASHNRTALVEQQIAAKVRAKYETRKATAREGVMDWNKDQARCLIRWGAEIPATATNNDVRNFLLKLIEQVPADDNLFIFESESGDGSVAASLGVSYGDAAAPDAAVPAELVATKAVLDELELPAEASLAQVHARIGELRTPAVDPADHERVVSELKAAKARIGELEATTEEEKLNQLVATNRARITPAKEPWFRALAKRHGIEHAAEVAKNLNEVLPTSDPASSVPPTDPAIAAKATPDGRPVNETGALRHAKVTRYMADHNISSYDEANEKLRNEESAAQAG